jgi:acetyl-CoA carboxylase biotin carboxyl carrier protein
MTPQEIKEFLKSIKETDIEEIQYQSGEDSFYFKKNEVEALIPEVKVSPARQEKFKEVSKPAFSAIKSTMVGTFANAASNDKPPLVREGSEVEVGQKVGQIEAMKIIKDVTSKIKGKIVKVCVSNGESVEYGQELFLVDTTK